jgi:hypothetical protein
MWHAEHGQRRTTRIALSTRTTYEQDVTVCNPFMVGVVDIIRLFVFCGTEHNKNIDSLPTPVHVASQLFNYRNYSIHHGAVHTHTPKPEFSDPLMPLYAPSVGLKPTPPVRRIRSTDASVRRIRSTDASVCTKRWPQTHSPGTPYTQHWRYNYM